MAPQRRNILTSKQLYMKNSLLIAVVLLMSATGIAQDQEWKIALHVDPNISWMKPENKNIEQGGSVMRFGFGIMIDKMFTENYAFGTGFNVFRTGGELSYLYRTTYTKDGASAATKVVANRVRTYNLQYIEIPLTLKLRTNEIGYITYWAQMGLGLGINIRAKGDDEITYVREYVEVADDPTTPETDESSQTWEPSSIRQQSREDEDINDDIDVFRTSLIVAAGIEYNLSDKTSILAGVTFNNGFNNVLNNKGVSKTDSGNPEIYNKVPNEFSLKSISNFISLNLGVLF